MKSIYVFILFLINLVTLCFSEPFTLTSLTTALIGLGAFVSYKSSDYILCMTNECCASPWINFNGASLEANLRRRLFGQHLAEYTILRSLGAHMKKENPKKALVMSFHGATGSGKNYVSHMIAESIYKNGMNSKYVHQYIANRDFPHKERVSEYQDKIQAEIIQFTKECSRSLFIFDEVDKMPPGTLDAVKPFIDYHENIDNVDYRKNIFIFLSNAGSQGIVDVALTFWGQGKTREDISMKDIEPLISKGAFNERGGFQFSELLRSELVDLYVPFLPLEKTHVRKCIKAYLESILQTRTEDIINKIADELVYFPPDAELYSASGCKRIDQKVDVEIGL